MSSLFANAFVLLQYLLPRYLLTSIVYRASRIRNTAVKNFFIERFVAAYDVDLAEVDKTVPDGFQTFNAFFTRSLSPGARTIDPAGTAIACPVDGTVSASGPIRAQALYQAKGKTYSLHDLLATNLSDAEAYLDGSFATVYLAPYNYHRVHAPLDGELVAMNYIPGDLFSVNAATVNGIPGLFCRNERLACHFRTDSSRFALIFVGALNVGSITTPWTGEIRPTRRGIGESMPLNGSVDRNVKKGDLLGWFNMGSTVILLLPRGDAAWQESFVAGQRCRFGDTVGTLLTDS